MAGSKRYNVTRQEENWQKRQKQNTSNITVNKPGRRVYTQSKQTWLVCLPILNCFIVCATVIGCYTIAILHGDLASLPYVPFVTEIGRNFPKSCFFSFGISASSFLTLILALLKYKQILTIYDGFMNRFALATGILASLSQLVVANFQMKDKVLWIHYIAVASYMIFSFMFCAIHVYLTRNTPAISNKSIFIIRIFLIEFMLVSGIVLGTFLFPDLSRMNNPPNNIAQIAGWFYLVFMQIFILTFVRDLKQMIFCLDILVTSSQAEVIYFGKRRLLEEEDDDVTSTRLSMRSKRSRNSTRTVSTYSQDDAILFNGSLIGKTRV